MNITTKTVTETRKIVSASFTAEQMNVIRAALHCSAGVVPGGTELLAEINSGVRGKHGLGMSKVKAKRPVRSYKKRAA